jgi:hypothetical protein
VQARQLAAALSLVSSDRNKEFGIDPKILAPVQNFLIALSDVMYRRPQRVLAGPEIEPTSIESQLNSTLGSSPLHRPVSLALLRLKTWSSITSHITYELHVNREAALAAALVASLQRCSPDDDIFVATPHRIQREAVKSALSRVTPDDDLLRRAFGRLQHGPPIEQAKVTVDTIERLQGKLNLLEKPLPLTKSTLSSKQAQKQLSSSVCSPYHMLRRPIWDFSWNEGA